VRGCLESEAAPDVRQRKMALTPDLYMAWLQLYISEVN